VAPNAGLVSDVLISSVEQTTRLISVFIRHIENATYWYEYNEYEEVAERLSPAGIRPARISEWRCFAREAPKVFIASGPRGECEDRISERRKIKQHEVYIPPRVKIWPLNEPGRPDCLWSQNNQKRRWESNQIVVAPATLDAPDLEDLYYTCALSYSCCKINIYIYIYIYIYLYEWKFRIIQETEEF